MRLKNQIETIKTIGMMMHREDAPAPAFRRKHRDEVDHKQHDDAPGIHGLIGKEAADRIDIRRGALNQLARLRLIVIAERQALDVIEQIIAQALQRCLPKFAPRAARPRT